MNEVLCLLLYWLSVCFDARLVDSKQTKLLFFIAGLLYANSIEVGFSPLKKKQKIHWL